ncbi:MAG TPA: hypothetical protein VD907_02510 [Verrucomicrobiae bacterium]|nr:hypothetical protein [Verrucomicrobiae bacterium]
MATRYFELRSLQKPTTTLAADIARHIQLRQRLGSALIICENPHALLSATRKQWLRLSRQLQLKRAATLNTEEILRLTHIIVLMQKMSFVAKTPEERPNAQVYFVTPEEAASMPASCYTLYITLPPSLPVAPLISSMPAASLVVDYTTQLPIAEFALHDKQELEALLLEKWQTMEALLASRGITVELLASQDPTTLSLLDHAIDSLLEISSQFLTAAFELQHAVDLAQPLVTVSAEKQKVFLIVTRLAYKVQSLSSPMLQNPFISDSYFLRDHASEQDPLQPGIGIFQSPRFMVNLLY